VDDKVGMDCPDEPGNDGGMSGNDGGGQGTILNGSLRLLY